MRNLAIGFLLATLVAGDPLGGAPPSGGTCMSITAAGTTSSPARSRRRRPDGSGPLRTLAKALRLAGPGDHIHLANTGLPYRESVSLVGNRAERHRRWAAGPRRQRRGAGRLAAGPGRPMGVLSRQPLPLPPAADGTTTSCFSTAGRPPRVFASAASDSPPKLQPRQWCAHHGLDLLRRRAVEAARRTTPCATPACRRASRSIKSSG